MKDRDSQMNGFHLSSYGKANIHGDNFGFTKQSLIVLLDKNNKFIGSPGEL